MRSKIQALKTFLTLQLHMHMHYLRLPRSLPHLVRTVDAVVGVFARARLAAGVVLFLPSFEFLEQTFHALVGGAGFVRTLGSRALLRETRGATA